MVSGVVFRRGHQACRSILKIILLLTSSTTQSHFGVIIIIVVVVITDNDAPGLPVIGGIFCRALAAQNQLYIGTARQGLLLRRRLRTAGLAAEAEFISASLHTFLELGHVPGDVQVLLDVRCSQALQGARFRDSGGGVGVKVEIEIEVGTLLAAVGLLLFRRWAGGGAAVVGCEQWGSVVVNYAAAAEGGGGGGRAVGVLIQLAGGGRDLVTGLV